MKAIVLMENEAQEGTIPNYSVAIADPVECESLPDAARFGMLARNYGKKTERAFIVIPVECWHRFVVSKTSDYTVRDG